MCMECYADENRIFWKEALQDCSFTASFIQQKSIPAPKARRKSQTVLCDVTDDLHLSAP